MFRSPCKLSIVAACKTFGIHVHTLPCLISVAQLFIGLTTYCIVVHVCTQFFRCFTFYFVAFKLLFKF